MDAKTDGLTIEVPGHPLTGRVTPPGSKSITNRALLLAALANGTSRLTGALKSDDTARWPRRCAPWASAIEEPDATSFTVTGTGRLQAPAGPLFLGNAGTATRFLTAAADHGRRHRRGRWRRAYAQAADRAAGRGARARSASTSTTERLPAGDGAWPRRARPAGSRSMAGCPANMSRPC
jgi:hypothetical protein